MMDGVADIDLSMMTLKSDKKKKMKFLLFWSLKVSPPGTAKDLKVLVSIV